MIRRILEVISVNSKYFWVSVILLISGWVVGFYNAAQLHNMVQGAIEQLKEIQEQFEQDPSTLNLFWFIFKNNVLAAMKMLAFGVFFGVFPVLALLTNGILIGYILKMGQMQDSNPWETVLYGILPHGVFEIFAVLLATMIGLRYGALSFHFLGGLFRRERWRSAKEGFRYHLSYLPLMVAVIIGLLFIAAIVESTVTPLLIRRMMDINM